MFLFLCLASQRTWLNAMSYVPSVISGDNPKSVIINPNNFLITKHNHNHDHINSVVTWKKSRWGLGNCRLYSSFLYSLLSSSPFLCCLSSPPRDTPSLPYTPVIASQTQFKLMMVGWLASANQPNILTLFRKVIIYTIGHFSSKWCIDVNVTFSCMTTDGNIWK